MKKVYILLSLLVAGILAGTVLVYYLWNKPNPDVSSASADFTVSAGDLVREFMQDAAAAHARYNKKIIKVRGSISSLETDASGNINIIFSGEGADVQCGLDSAASSSPKALQLEPGQAAAVKGRYSGMIEDDIVGNLIKINKCVLEP